MGEQVECPNYNELLQKNDKNDAKRQELEEAFYRAMNCIVVRIQ